MLLAEELECELQKQINVIKKLTMKSFAVKSEHNNWIKGDYLLVTGDGGQED